MKIVYGSCTSPERLSARDCVDGNLYTTNRRLYKGTYMRLTDSAPPPSTSRPRGRASYRNRFADVETGAVVRPSASGTERCFTPVDGKVCIEKAS